MGKVIRFPQSVIARRDLRCAQRRLARADAIIEAGPQGDGSRFAGATYESALVLYDMDVEALRKAQAAVAMLDADDSLHHRGMVYRAYVSIEGAN